MEWNEETGLFRRPGPGHTAPVADAPIIHSYPETFIAFAIDAQVHRFDATRFHNALQVLEKAQVHNLHDPLFGCLPVYLEESRPVDTNASFFVGLTLIFIERAYGTLLRDSDRELLTRIFYRLDKWFERELAENSIFYPNKHLGDLVCSLLLSRILGNDARFRLLEDKAANALQELNHQNWGWGEHLSYVYTTVLLTEISLLLTLLPNLRADLRDSLVRTGTSFLKTHDFFDGGAWTPSIRCYAFETPPVCLSYRKHIRPWHHLHDAKFLSELPPQRFMALPFAHFLHEHGWHEIFPSAEESVNSALELPCGFGVTARAWKSGDWRLGCLSRYPLNTAWDTHRWGLSWQSFPVAVACADQLWGFQQWRAHWQDGTIRAHPAESKESAYLQNALVPDGPARTGQTLASQETGSVHVQRHPPDWHPDWCALDDRWTFFLPQDASVHSERVDTWHATVISFAKRRLRILARRTAKPEAPIVRRSERMLTITFTYHGPAEDDFTEWRVQIDPPSATGFSPELNG